jgi:hypothetical protein
MLFNVYLDVYSDNENCSLTLPSTPSSFFLKTILKEVFVRYLRGKCAQEKDRLADHFLNNISHVMI